MNNTDSDTYNLKQVNNNCVLFCIERVCCVSQSMLGVTFKSLIKGKQSSFEEKLNVDQRLLSKLEECGIITDLQRRKIEVNFVIVLCVLLELKGIIYSSVWQWHIKCNPKHRIFTGYEYEHSTRLWDFNFVARVLYKDFY